MNTLDFQKLGAIVFLLCSSCSREGSGGTGSDSLNSIYALPIAAQRVFEEITRSGYYHKPTYQDCVVQSNDSLDDKSYFADNRAHYSFAPYYPFILSPRRQTDQLVMQLYEQLPESVKSKWAFVIADRLVQNPEKYVDYIAARQQVYIVGAINGTSSVKACAAGVVPEKILALTYRFLRGMGFSSDQISVMYAKGDSPDRRASGAREVQEDNLNTLLLNEEQRLLGAEKHLSKSQAPEVRVTWGADELVHLAFTNALVRENPTTAEVIISDPNRTMHYDGDATIDSIVKEKLLAAGIGYRSQGTPASFKLIIHSADSGKANSENTWNPSGGDSNAAYVDMRMEFNGALDYEWAPVKNCNNLAYSAWGTASNAVGSAIATAVTMKNSIERDRKNDRERQKLFLEAVAHDAVYIGYRMRNLLKSSISNTNITYQYNARYFVPETEMQNSLTKSTGIVQNVMDNLYKGTNCMLGKKVRLSTQLNRFFEANTIVESK